jgi:putative hydrolase of the HAD superfamily
MPPRGLLFDFGGTLVEEVAFNTRAGIELLVTHAAYRPPQVSVEQIVERAERISREVAQRRDQFHIETPWASLTRLIHDVLGGRFDVPLGELELPFWNAAAVTRPMPGARDALRELHRSGLPMGVVSNTSFGQHVIRHELAKHGLADHLAAIVVSAEYAVRKPNPLLFEVGAARIGVASKDIWFMGDRLDTDVAGAKAAGMTAIHFGPDATWPDLVAMFRNAR